MPNAHSGSSSRSRLEARLKRSLNARNEGRLHGLELRARPITLHLVKGIEKNRTHKHGATIYPAPSSSAILKA